MFSPVNNKSGKIANGNVHNTEVYIGGSWKLLSLKYSHAFSRLLLAPDTNGSNYLDLIGELRPGRRLGHQRPRRAPELQDT